jgi:hypothetical protein
MDTTANVVIEAGVTIAFEQNAGIGVYDSGSLRADGIGGQPVDLVGTSAQKGWWRGIHVESATPLNQLRHVRVEDAGSSYVYCCNEAASIFHRGGRLSLESVDLRNGAGYGLVARAEGSFDAYEDVAISDHDDYPARVSLRRLAELDGMGSDYGGNAVDFVEIDGARVDTPVRMPRLDVPYLWNEGVVDVIAALTIDAGAEIAFGQNAGLGVYDAGRLAVDGTSTTKVVFRGTSASRGWWRGIHLETADPGNRLRYLDMRNAGSSYVYCCNEVASLLFKDGEASMVGTTVADGGGFGIYAANQFSFSDFSGNRITGHTSAPVYAAIERIAELDGTASSYMGNDVDFIRVFNSQANSPITWRATDVPYLVDDEAVIDLRAPVDIRAGAEIVFGADSGLGVYDGGVFSVAGTSNDEVIFRGLIDVQGFWRGLYSETDSTANQIAHASIRNAGSSYVYCCDPPAAVYVRGGRMTVEDSAIEDSGGCGIGYRSAATLTQTNNTFSNNASGNVCAE